MDWLYLTEIVLAGLGAGALYALTGVAFVLIYKATRVVNLAIGEILMLGGYTFFGLVAGFGLPVWAAIPLTVASGAVLGMVMDISDHVVVLNFGQVIARGEPAAVQRDPAVIAAYLGSGDLAERLAKAEAA